MFPDGRVLMWSAFDKLRFTGSSNQGKVETAIFDPRNGRTTNKLITNVQHDMFCPGAVMLGNGKLLTSGGAQNTQVSLFDFNHNSWSKGPQMNIKRGYHGACALADGGVFTLGGSWSNGGLRNQQNGEVYVPSQHRWVSKPGIKITEFLAGGNSDWYMWFFQAPWGGIFHAGPSPQMHYISLSGNGSKRSVGSRQHRQHSGTACMYDVGKILTVGGSSTNVAYTIDINSSSSIVQKRTGSMKFKRTHHNSVVMPNGEVAIIGGLTSGKSFSDEGTVFEVEIWNPRTGQFRVDARMKVPRNYHATALLSRDGTIVAAGGGLCGGCAVNHPDAEVYTPPYLRANRPRPVIRSGPSHMSPGQKISFSVSGGSSSSYSFALVRTAAVTHSVNSDQRRIPLRVVSRSGTTSTLQLPSSRNVLIPGGYFLFAMDSAGTPSLAKYILSK